MVAAGGAGEDQALIRDELALQGFGAVVVLKNAGQLAPQRLQGLTGVETALAAEDVVGLDLSQQSLAAAGAGQPVVAPPLHFIVQRLVVGHLVFQILLVLVDYRVRAFARCAPRREY